ncbi:uncharacterized protein LOC111290642 isoform X2 [Durio zibethinus]|nr:uncharacterized protein LOC111290642 isoform X2 [Durio zibethinus]XP_022737779.1 uncharacterized protein LOC111290642 isoform X2 [Durio zibethinus]
MGGGSAGRAKVLRTAGRAAVSRTGATTGNPTAFQEPLHSAPSSPTSASQRHNNNNSNGYLSIASGASAFGSCNGGVPISANSGLPSNRPAFASSPVSAAASCCDEFEWVFLDGCEEDKPHPHGVFDDIVLGTVPSVGEVQNVVSALQRVFDASSCPQLIRDKVSYNAGKDVAYQISSPTDSVHWVQSAGPELDWMEPSLHLYNTGALQPYGTNRVYDAFHLLQTEPMVKKMVISLSSDKAVWNAVLNNEVVRELRESYHAAEDINPLSSDESLDENSDESNNATNIVKWIFDNTKAKAMDLFEKITKLVNELFKPPPDNETTTAGTPDPFEERLRTSFLLSVVVLLVVVVTRARTA